MRQQDIENLAKGQSLEENPFGDHRSLNRIADDLEKERITGVWDLDGLEEIIKKDIKIHVKINAEVAFHFGEMFTIGKKVCQKQKVGFQKWLLGIIDFSYETALNYMNVYKYCTGNMVIAQNVPISILCKISTPSFDDDLREYLFDSGMLTENTTEKRLLELIAKYKQGGIEAIEAELENMCEQQLIRKQIMNTLNLFKQGQGQIKELQLKIECRGGSTKDNFLPFEKRLENDYPIAREIIIELYKGLKKANEFLDATEERSRIIFDEYIEENSRTGEST